MVMKKDGRKRDIKSKLVAAVCMLLVSCIMMVSSTYAWFTLSTAPEVTGITTAIGANGNLEMALLPGLDSTGAAFATVKDALDAIGDANGTQSVVEKNTTWGNLVDLSDERYGLDQISLFPAALGLSGTNLADYYLGTPQYGSDGRFTGLGNNASAMIYNNGTFGTNSFGVRAVGTSSGMSAHELAFRDVLSDANDAFNKAITQAKNATSQGGSALASLAVAKATGTTSFTQEDIAKLVTAYSAMDNAMSYIETALKNYIIAYTLSNGGLNETTYLTTLNAMKGMELAGMGTYAQGELGTALTSFNTTNSTIDTTLAALRGMTADTYAWGDISTYVTALADVDLMLLNGKAISYYMKDNYANINELVSNMSNLVLEVNAGGGADSGLYVQMANFVDDYTTPVTISGIEYSGITVDNLSATMKIYKAVTAAHLPTAKNAAMTYDPDAFGTGGGSSLSDFYGYIIDMAFRTNAAGSSLQLQTDATDRVYADNESNPNTMGGGSSMTYSVAGVEGFGTDQLENLMSYIRVVFFDPTTNTILGYARLDPATAEEEGDETTGFSVTMKLKMWDPNANGEGQGAWASSSVITALQQNTAAAVSTLVYLDGEELTNADVANANLTGTMNIQFSSTAELKPMEYGDLRNGNTETTDPATPAVTEVKVDTANSTQNYTYKATAVTVGENQGISVVITDSNDAAVTTGTVTIAGVNATYSAETSSWIAAYSGAIDSTTSVVVTVA